MPSPLAQNLLPPPPLTLLQGDRDPAGLPYYDGVEEGFIRGGQGDQVGELASAAGRVGIDGLDGELVGVAVVEAGGFLGFLGDDALSWGRRVLDVDGNVGYG